MSCRSPPTFIPTTPGPTPDHTARPDLKLKPARLVRIELRAAVSESHPALRMVTRLPPSPRPPTPRSPSRKYIVRASSTPTDRRPATPRISRPELRAGRAAHQPHQRHHAAEPSHESIKTRLISASGYAAATPGPKAATPCRRRPRAGAARTAPLPVTCTGRRPGERPGRQHLLKAVGRGGRSSPGSRSCRPGAVATAPLGSAENRERGEALQRGRERDLVVLHHQLLEPTACPTTASGTASFPYMYQKRACGPPGLTFTFTSCRGSSVSSTPLTGVTKLPSGVFTTRSRHDSSLKTYTLPAAARPAPRAATMRSNRWCARSAPSVSIGTKYAS